MRTAPMLLSATLLPLLAAPAAGQSLAERVDRVRDGDIRMSFAARAGICGNGDFIGEETPDGFRTHTFSGRGMYSISSYRHVRPVCHEGPVRLVVEKRGGAIRDLQLAVGVPWRADVDAADLGTVRGADAATWLLDLAASHPDDDVIRRAVFAASLADSAFIAERLIRMVEDRDLRAVARSRAMRVVTEAAAREGRADRADQALRRVAADQQTSGDLRERAVRELRETEANDAFLRETYARGGPLDVRERIIRRLGESPTDANVRWVRGIATDDRQPPDLRERAIRVLGEMGRFADLRAMYDDVGHPDLQERILRVVAEEEGRDAAPWLREVATNTSVHVDVRERAVRLLGEQRELAALQRLYPELDRVALRERVLRVVGEYGDAESLGWIEEVARTRSEAADVRERAVRILAEERVPSERLATLYDELDAQGLKERLIRIFADRRDAAALDKLRAIATGDPSSDLRRAAERRLR